MSTQPFFTLVFVNYQSASHLRQALFSLYKLETDSSLYEVVVVNNDSREESDMASLQALYPSLRQIENQKNMGFGAAANLGAEGATGQVIGFLNPDLIWKEPLLRELRELFSEEKNLGIAGPRLLTEAGSPELWSNGAEPSLFQIFKNNTWFFQNRGSVRESLERATPKDWISGAALFIRANLFHKRGGFDERFFLYFEDVDLCRRVRDDGYAVKLLSTVSVFHKSGKSQASSEEQKRHFYKSQDRYFQKYSSPVSYFFLRIFRFLRHGS